MNLYELRLSKGYIEQKTFAQQLGITPSTLCMWEKGKAIPRLKMMKKLAQLLNVSLDEIVQAIDNSKEQLWLIKKLRNWE